MKFTIKDLCRDVMLLTAVAVIMAAGLYHCINLSNTCDVVKLLWDICW